ncbi:MAG: hypothetical protein P0Y65_01495 [Candidatus Devosia phytovorans]|uniref:DUF2188 domain-containing protein n=1 Tax=Candidatus Devosia phytovorans TaxID=3121372 RepID=A0AAJ5VX06_9HYPH|nr:hypothetical protein [Devosia sp.]WEK04954.1 MAG: hypothetical protein P0Y65_01495 [Devosia sp.]
MCSHHFVVAAQDHAWHFSYKGALTGPFDSRERAVKAAIEQATQEEEPSVEVLVRDESQNMETVWRPSQTA